MFPGNQLDLSVCCRSVNPLRKAVVFVAAINSVPDWILFRYILPNIYVDSNRRVYFIDLIQLHQNITHLTIVTIILHGLFLYTIFCAEKLRDVTLN